MTTLGPPDFFVVEVKPSPFSKARSSHVLRFSFSPFGVQMVLRCHLLICRDLTVPGVRRFSISVSDV